MKPSNKGVRGNNKFSKALNKEIDGNLAKNQSKKVIIIILGICFLLIWWYTVEKLGFKSGSIITLVLLVFVIAGEMKSRDTIKAASKHKWKAFNDKEK